MNDNETATNNAGSAPPSTAVAAAERPKLMPVIDDSEFSSLLDSNRFGQIQRVAALFAESDLIPEVFQGKTANCAVALQMAFRMRVDPMMLMQNMYIVHGKPGIEAKLAIALMNTRGPFSGPLQWRFAGEGDKRQCTCFATHKATGREVSQTITWAMVIAEGWISKTGSKWKTMPDIMFQYRSAMFLGRLYCPEVLLGLPTQDELYDIGGGERAVEGVRVDDYMPRPASESGNVIQHPAQQHRQEPAATEQKAEAIDTSTGEITAGSAEVKAEGQPAQQETKTEPTAKSGEASMKPLSDAQKRMLVEMARKKGLSVAQLDELLVERFAFGSDELPVTCVSKAAELIGGLKAA